MLSAAAVAVLLGLGSCGDAESPERGTLEIVQTRSPDRPLGVEGSASFVVVKDGDKTVARASSSGAEAMGRVDLLTESLLPGQYRVVAFQKDTCLIFALHARPWAPGAVKLVDMIASFRRR